MATFSFSIVVDGVDAADDDHVELLGTYEEVVMLSSTEGVTTIDLAVEARTDADAVRAAVHLVEGAIEGCAVRRVDLDLVAATDVAERVDVSRQAVGQWVSGHRSFPAPLGTVAGGTRVWAWSAVLPWLHQRGRLQAEETLSYQSIVEANALLARPRVPGRLAVAGSAAST